MKYLMISISIFYRICLVTNSSLFWNEYMSVFCIWTNRISSLWFDIHNNIQEYILMIFFDWFSFDCYVWMFFLRFVLHSLIVLEYRTNRIWRKIRTEPSTAIYQNHELSTNISVYVWVEWVRSKETKQTSAISNTKTQREHKSELNVFFLNALNRKMM